MDDRIKDVMGSEAEELMGIKYLTPENAVFYETKGGFVALKLDGEDKGIVNIIRTFPLTQPDMFLSIRNPEGKQEEYGIIETLKSFDADTKKLFDKQLRLRYYMPRITSVINVKEEYGYTYWTVDTDKGRAGFASSSGSAGSVIHHGKGVIIMDSNQNRYCIEDLDKLSVKELKKIDLYL